MKKIILILVMLFCGIAGLAGTASAYEPLGYPYSSWGEVGQTFEGLEKGLKADGYLEQGVDWVKLHNWTLNTFAGFRFTFSDQAEQYWNNKYGPWLGLKIKRPLPIASWGEIAIGARIEYYDYLNPHNQELRAVGFLQWSFGGDWKKGRR
ncbi:MAG: hypothetical protein AAB851_04120 [Patescibacteria group bacterium]